MASIIRALASPLTLLLLLVLASLAAAQTLPYDRAYLRSGNRLAFGCGRCCRAACQLTYFNQGTLARIAPDTFPGRVRCARSCQRLLPICERACSNAVAVNTVDTVGGCGCTAPRLFPARALVRCRNACRNALVACRRRCTNLTTCPLSVRLELSWTARVNGTCAPVCESRTPVGCL